MQVTTSFPNFLEKGIKKVYSNMSMKAMEESFFTKWARKYSTNEYSENFISDEGIDDFAPLAESGSIKDLTRGTGYKVTITSDEYAGKLVVTKKMRIRAGDDTTKLGQLLSKDMKKIVESGRRHIEKRVHAMLDNGFVTTGVTTPGNGIVLAPDTKALFATDHTWNSTGATFSNKGTRKFTMDAWEEALTQMTNLTDANGGKMPINLNTIVVKMNSDVAYRVKRLFFGKVYATNVQLDGSLTDINIHQDNADGIRIIETPYLSSSDAWYAYDRSEVNPFIVKMVQNPTMEDRQIRENLDYVYPATISYENGCDNMPYAWFGSTGSDA